MITCIEFIEILVIHYCYVLNITLERFNIGNKINKYFVSSGDLPHAQNDSMYNYQGTPVLVVIFVFQSNGTISHQLVAS